MALINKRMAPALFNILSNKADDTKNGHVIFFAIPLLVLETIIFYLGFTEIITLTFTAFLHLLLIVASGMFVWVLHRKKKDLRFSLLLLLAVIAAGPLGVAGFLLLALFYALFSKMAVSPDKWFKELFPDEETPIESSFQRIKVGWDDYKEIKEIAAFQDIFTYGTLQQKQGVLDAIVKDFHMSYAPILKIALEYPSNTIRLQAAAVIEKINMEYEEKLKALLTQKVENPNDSEIILKIANLLNNQASSGIIGNFRQNETLKEAIIYYREYLKREPNHRMALFSVGRLLFQKADYKEFLEWCDEYKNKFTDLPSVAKDLYLEAKYKSR